MMLDFPWFKHIWPKQRNVPSKRAYDAHTSYGLYHVVVTYFRCPKGVPITSNDCIPCVITSCRIQRCTFIILPPEQVSLLINCLSILDQWVHCDQPTIEAIDASFRVDVTTTMQQCILPVIDRSPHNWVVKLFHVSTTWWKNADPYPPIPPCPFIFHPHRLDWRNARIQLHCIDGDFTKRRS